MLEAAQLEAQELGREKDSWVRTTGKEADRASEFEKRIWELESLVRELETQLAAEKAKPRVIDLADYDVDRVCAQVRSDVWDDRLSIIELVSLKTGETMLEIMAGLVEPRFNSFEPVVDVRCRDDSGMQLKPMDEVREYLAAHQGTFVYERLI